MNKVLHTKVAGVTYEGRQTMIALLTGREPCRLVPEPTNPYDPNAIAVMVATVPGVVWHIGYIPKEIAAQIAPFLDGEAIDVKIAEIVGGFETHDGDTAALDVRLRIELPGLDEVVK